MTALQAPPASGQASLEIPPPHPLWFYVLKLLRLRWVIFASGFRRAKPIRKVVTIFIGLLVLGVFAGSFALTAYLLNLLDSPVIAQAGVDLSSFVSAIPVLVVSGAFLAILLTSFGVLLQALYLANDMDFLLAAPIPIRAVFITKLLQAILPNFTLIGLVGLPVLFGLGVGYGYNFLYFPMVLLVLASLSLSAAGISSLLVMAVVRVLPARRVAEVLAFLGATFSILCSQISNLTRGSDFGALTPERISRGTGYLAAVSSPWSPLAWGGRGLVDLGEGRWLAGIFFLVLTLGLSSAAFWFALNTAERLYYTGWASIQAGTQRKKTRRATRRQSQGRGEAREWSKMGSTLFASPLLIRRLVPPEVRAIMCKDSLVLRRDLRNMSQVVTPLIMGIVFAVMFLRGGGQAPAGRGEAPAVYMEVLQSAMAYMSMGISLFVGWSLLSRLALMAFSMEGQSYWIIKASPASAGRQLAAKFLIAYLPALALGWLFLLGIALLQKAPPTTILYGFPAVALILAGLDGINLAFGVTSAKLDWTDPRRMSGGATGCLGMLASGAYLVLALGLFFAPPIGFPLLNLSEGVGQLVGLLAGGSLALLCAFLPPMLVRQRVYRIGEA